MLSINEFKKTPLIWQILQTHLEILKKLLLANGCNAAAYCCKDNADKSGLMNLFVFLNYFNLDFFIAYFL
jgi:ankyrin repeat protein